MGSAIKTTRKWYEITVDSLRKKNWDYGVYAAGVTSHYYTDPIMPFHTAQSQEETNIHRAVEWSVAKSYDAISELARGQGYPEVEPAESDDWLEQMVIEGAELSHQYYHQLIEHYDFDRGVSNPLAGLDAESRKFLARLLAHASVGFARILERAFEEADVQPPITDPTLHGYLAALQIPIYWILKKMSDGHERDIVEQMYDELQETGKVERTLTEDDRIIKHLHAREVGTEPLVNRTAANTHSRPKPIASVSKDREPIHKSEVTTDVPAVNRNDSSRDAPVSTRSDDDLKFTERETVSRSVETPVASSFVESPVQGSRHEERTERPAEESSSEKETSLRFRLEPSDGIVDAPSIGTKTAKRLKKVGIGTVRDLLDADAEDLANSLGVHYIDAQMISDWQDQATLCCRVPEIRGHDAQILVACEFRTPDKIASSDPASLLSVVEPFIGTSKGEQIVRGGSPPDLEEVTAWIDWAQHARPLRAA